MNDTRISVKSENCCSISFIMIHLNQDPSPSLTSAVTWFLSVLLYLHSHHPWSALVPATSWSLPDPRLLLAAMLWPQGRYLIYQAIRWALATASRFFGFTGCFNLNAYTHNVHLHTRCQCGWARISDRHVIPFHVACKIERVTGTVNIIKISSDTILWRNALEKCRSSSQRDLLLEQPDPADSRTASLT